MMKDLVFAQALLLTGQLEEKQQELLRLLCGAAASSLALRLKAGVTPESCGADFIAAASLYAVAALSQTDDAAQMEQISMGDLTLRRGGCDAASSCLRYQAELMMLPYLKDRFAFLGV